MPPPLRAAAPFAIAYRPTTDDDLPFLAALYASTRAEEVAVTGWPEDIQRQFLTQQFEAQHRHYRAHYPDAEWLVVERGGEQVGRLYLEQWSGELRIIDIALMPHARGLGLGAAMLEDILEQARHKGSGVSIHVEKNNPAMRLYRRLGFVPVADKGVYDLLLWSGEPAGA